MGVLFIHRYMTYIIVEAIILAATAFYGDATCPTPGKAFITETSLRANLLTGGISAAGTGVATVCTTQLIMAVGWTVKPFISKERNDVSFFKNTPLVIPLT